MSILNGTLPIDEQEWPRNLADVVLGKAENDELSPQETAMYIGDEGTLACAMLAARLTERERNVLHHRFVQHESLMETGKHFNVTTERIRQVEAKAIRKLRRPVCLKILRMGVYQWMLETARELAEEMSVQKARQMFVEWQRNFTEDWEAAAENQERIAVAKENAVKGIDAITVEEMDLSVRSFNCLKRAGFSNVGDIRRAAEKDRDWYRKVRNLGKKSYEEIAAKMLDYGVDIAMNLVNDEEAGD